MSKRESVTFEGGSIGSRPEVSRVVLQSAKISGEVQSIEEESYLYFLNF